MKTLKVKIEMVVKVPEAADLNDILLDVHSINLGVYDKGGIRKVRHSTPNCQIGTITEIK